MSRRSKFDESTSDRATVPIPSGLNRDATSDQIFVYENELKNVTEWMNQALNWSSERFWSTLLYAKDAKNVLEKTLLAFPRVHELEAWTSIRSSGIEPSVHKALSASLAFFLRIAIYSKEKDQTLSETEYGILLQKEELLPMRTIALAVSAFALGEGSTTEQLLVKIVTSQLRRCVEYKDDVRTVLSEHSQLMSSMSSDIKRFVEAFTKSRGAQRIRLARILDSFLSVAVSQQFMIDRFCNIIRKSGMRLEWRKIAPGVPQLVDAVYKCVTTELLFEVAASFPEYPIRRLLRLRSQFESYSAKLFHQCIVSMDGHDVRLQTIKQANSCDRFLYVFDEFCPLETLISNASPTQRESFLVGLESIRQTHKVKLAEEVESTGMFKNLGDTTLLDPGMQDAVHELTQILPQHSAQYVHLCLRHYGGDQEKALSALLSDSLPLTLKRLQNTDLTENGVPVKLPFLTRDWQVKPSKPESNGSLNSPNINGQQKPIPKNTSLKSLFSLAPPTEKAIENTSENVENNQVPMKSSKDETLKQLRSAFERLCLQIEPMQTNEEGEVVEKLYKKTSKYKNIKNETARAGNVSMRPFYDKYKFETEDDDETRGENLYDDEYDDAYEEKAFAVDPQGSDESSDEDDSGKKLSNAEFPVLGSARNSGYVKGEVAVGNRTGRGLPRGMLSGGRGRGRGGGGGEGQGGDRGGRGAQGQGWSRDDQRQYPEAIRQGYRREFNPEQMGSEQGVTVREYQGGGGEAGRGGSRQTTYTGGRDRQYKEKHKNEQKRRGADRKMRGMGI